MLQANGGKGENEIPPASPCEFSIGFVVYSLYYVCYNVWFVT